MTALPDRPLSAPEAEAGVIGALMRKPDLCESVGSFLDRAHFSDADLGALYAITLMAKAKQMHPDAVTVSEICPFLPSGADTLQAAASIQMSTTSAANADVYAKIIIERYRARKLLEVSERIAELAMSRGRVVDQIAEAQALVMDLMADDDSPDVISMREALRPVFDEMQDRIEGKAQMGIEFGLSDLDRHVNQMRPGNLVIIAGRPGTGKTVLGMQVAQKVALRDSGSALIFSLEMPAKELAKRSLASVSGVTQSGIDSGESIQSSEDEPRISLAVAKLSGSDIRICDKPALPLSRIASISRFQHRASPLSLIVVDYIGLVAGEPGAKNLNRNQELGAVSRGLKALAKELSIPIVALAQLNRSIENRADAKPRMSDLRDSGEIEQDADVIIMAHRDPSKELGENGVTEIDVVKCRHGKPGGCLLQFRGEFARFELLARSEYERYQSDPEPDQYPGSARAMLGRRK